MKLASNRRSNSDRLSPSGLAVLVLPLLSFAQNPDTKCATAIKSDLWPSPADITCLNECNGGCEVYSTDDNGWTVSVCACSNNGNPWVSGCCNLIVRFHDDPKEVGYTPSGNCSVELGCAPHLSECILKLSENEDWMAHCVEY